MSDGQITNGSAEPTAPDHSDTSYLALIPGWLVRAMGEMMYEVGHEKFPDAFEGSVRKIDPRGLGLSEKLGRKAIRLLALMAEEDLTLNEAANKLCMSIHTANQHIAAARKLLRVETTNGAVYAAMEEGLIEV